MARIWKNFLSPCVFVTKSRWVLPADLLITWLAKFKPGVVSTWASITCVWLIHSGEMYVHSLCLNHPFTANKLTRWFFFYQPSFFIHINTWSQIDLMELRDMSVLLYAAVCTWQVRTISALFCSLSSLMNDYFILVRDCDRSCVTHWAFLPGYHIQKFQTSHFQYKIINKIFMKIYIYGHSDIWLIH